MSKPKVSIIVPVYNAQDRLAVCVDSILNQSFSGFELILVNDGSKDNSLLICNEYAQKDSRVVVVDKENSGAGETRNAGLDKAQGEYVVFVDADDSIDQSALEKLLQLITADEDIDMVCCNHYIEFADSGDKTFNEKMNIDGDFCVYDDKAQALYIMEEVRSFCYPWNKIFKREIIQKNNIRFEKQFVTGEDLDFVIKYYYHTRKVVLTNTPLYVYYKDGVGSLCARYKKDLYSMVAELSDRRYRLFCALGMDENEKYMELYGKTHIEYLHSCIPNMYRKNSNLSLKEKVQQMKAVFDDKGLSKYMGSYSESDKLSKVFKSLYVKGNPRLAVCVYSMMFFVRNNMSSIYQKLRK